MDRQMYGHTDGWNFPRVFYRTSSPIGSAAQKHRDVNILFSKIVHAHASLKDDNKSNDEDFMITDQRKDDNATTRRTSEKKMKRRRR